MSHFIRSPFDSLIRSISLPLQFNSYPSTQWCDVREAAVRATSQPGLCVKKADFYVRSRLNQVDLLVSPRTDLQSRVKEPTGFPDVVAQIVGEYYFDEDDGPDVDRPKVFGMCRNIVKSDAFQSTLSASAVAGVASTASAAASAVIGDGAVGILASAGTLTLRLRYQVTPGSYASWVFSAPAVTTTLVTLAKAAGAGTLGAGMTAVSGTVASVVAGLAIQSVRAGHSAGLTAHRVLEGGKIALWLGSSVAAATAVAPAGRILIIEAVALLTLFRAASLADRARKAATGKVFDAKTGASAIQPVVFLTLANCAVELATGSPMMSPPVYITTTLVTAGGLSAHRHRPRQE